MRLSRNFTLAEFIRSANADELGLDNTPGPDHLANLKVTALGLEMVRALFGGKPVTVTSGYRNPQVNRAAGGVPNSAHALGYAADISIAGVRSYAVAAAIAESDIAFDQVIYEKGRNITHISFDPRLRGQTLTQHEGPRGPTLQGIVP